MLTTVDFSWQQYMAATAAKASSFFKEIILSISSLATFNLISFNLISYCHSVMQY